MRALEFTPEAAADLRQAYRWYEAQRRGLGDEFSRAIEATVTRVAREPGMSRVIAPPFRCALVRRFPYLVCFDFDPDKVVVLAVFHTSQNPNKLTQRLRQP